MVCAVFTNRLEGMSLQDVAAADTTQLVSEVQEFFGDFEVLDQHHFSTSVPKPYVLLQPAAWEYADRCELMPCRKGRRA